MREFHVDYERSDEGRWSASVRGLAGCSTHGRTLTQARARVRVAIAVTLDDDSAATRARLVDHLKLPSKVRAMVKAAETARQRLAGAELEARTATADAARGLLQLGLGLRDAGELLGLSHQRIDQIAGKKAPRTPAK